VDLSRFVGLEDVFDDIDQLVDAQAAGSASSYRPVGVLLVAPRGTGKSNRPSATAAPGVACD
jgi:hypothetical protein